MKQIIQNYSTGRLELTEVPVPLCSNNTILVRNEASLVSIGTERSIIDLGRKSLLGKAKARPDLVKRFIEKSQKEGLIKTFQEALGRLDTPTALGYSSAGVVVEAGKNINEFSPGDRVACIGPGYASHAGYVKVPENLCCKIPDDVSFEEASFGMLGIIALHGIRCAGLNFGESVAVTGLGLLGLLCVQILKAYGCRVIGTDIDPEKVKMAEKLGIDRAASLKDFKQACDIFTNGTGVDASVLTVATDSPDPVNDAVDIVRYGGKVVVVGVADIHPSRNEMWHKEVEIVVSKAGGPGTFDPLYENKGIDYHSGYVRWTQKRNLSEFLRLVSEKRVDVKTLISHQFIIDEAEKAYHDIMNGKGGPYIGVVLKYPSGSCDYDFSKRLMRLNSDTAIINSNGKAVLGVIGAGLFGKALLLPALRKVNGIDLHTISASSSANTIHTAKKYGFRSCTTDYREVMDNREIDGVLILTPHSLHAGMVVDALNAGKHVFVEKPLCVDEDELEQIIDAIGEHKGKFLMVGYNRRFSPHAREIRKFFSGRTEPMVIHYRINAGFVPKDHWVHSEEEGGSRIIGEVCHFVDLMQYLTGSNPVRVYAERVSAGNKTTLNNDNVILTIKFEDGSIGSIVYSASGDRAFSREHVEVYCEGSTAACTDYRNTEFYRYGRKKVFKTINQSMGYKEELAHFCGVVSGKESPCIEMIEPLYSTMTVFSINYSLEKQAPVDISLRV